MTDDTPWDGFLFEISVSDATAAGGRRRRDVYVVARGRQEADAIVQGLLPTAVFVGSGEDVLKMARHHEVADGGLRVVRGKF
jgi:hypothetical protein